MKLSKLRAAHVTRTIRGETVPRQNTTSFGMRTAMKKAKGAGYAGTGEADGGSARPRLDRPGRKSGGRVCKADGGETPYKRERLAGLGAMAGSRSIPRALMGAYTALGAGAGTAAKAGQAVLKKSRADTANKEGDEAEGHKSGGRIRRAYGGTTSLKDRASQLREMADEDEKQAQDDEQKSLSGTSTGTGSSTSSVSKFARGGFLGGMKKNALHKSLGVPAGEKIPEKKLERAEHSSNPKLRKRAILAQTMKSWKHGKN